MAEGAPTTRGYTMGILRSKCRYNTDISFSPLPIHPLDVLALLIEAKIVYNNVWFQVIFVLNYILFFLCMYPMQCTYLSRKTGIIYLSHTTERSRKTINYDSSTTKYLISHMNSITPNIIFN